MKCQLGRMRQWRSAGFGTDARCSSDSRRGLVAAGVWGREGVGRAEE